MSCLIPPACVFCCHYHTERNERSDQLPSCDAFTTIPDAIFLGRFDHSKPYRGDKGVRFTLIETERQDFIELNAVRGEMGLLVYCEPVELHERDEPARSPSIGLQTESPVTSIDG